MVIPPDEWNFSPTVYLKGKPFSNLLKIDPGSIKTA
jgi:hypothetical protein